MLSISEKKPILVPYEKEQQKERVVGYVNITHAIPVFYNITHNH